MLATLEELKDRLELDPDDESQDADLLIALTAASGKVLDLCRYTEENEERVEILRSVRQGRELQLRRRPITGLTAEGRWHGASFSPLTADLVDPTEGVIVLVASADWPPSATEPRAGRGRLWPVVRVTYQTAGIDHVQDAPDALREATLGLAHFWLSKHKAGAADMKTVGPLSQMISKLGMPASVRSALGEHYRGVGGSWV